MRPDGTETYRLSEREMDALTWMVVSGCPRQDAFLIFAHPEYAHDTNLPVVQSAVKQFFAMKDVKSYLEDYKITLEDALHPKVRSVDPGTIEERKVKARQKAMEYAIKMADELGDSDVDAEMILKVLDKVGILDGDEAVIEAPRRYIPVTCSDCEYRKFVEENCYREDGKARDLEDKD